MVLKSKYKVGSIYKIRYRRGFPYQNEVIRDAEVIDIDENTSGIFMRIKTTIPSGGYKIMFGYEYQFDQMVIE